MKIPFNVYDFFAYLASGMVVGVSLDVGFGESWSLIPEPTPVQIGLLTVAAYILGQVVAQLSALLLESGLAKRMLGPPSDLLMGLPGGRVRAFFFPGYHKALPETTRARIKAAASAENVPTHGEPLFLLAFGLIGQEALQRERLDSFRTLYGFSRNMCLACLVSGAILLWMALGDGNGPPLLAPVVTLGASVFLLYRYLKFFRQYTYQLLVLFAEWNRGEEG